ncbi:head maturation protease, ClpP-related [Anaerostipes sp. Marseille-Q3525]|uniref:head maturation protease, ClpP-related n=1 Tax=Anaerostipes sp. Marseille-Q3525 TaxID=2758418 RepID=UPI001BACF8E2|nr:head maturation protease, ClpP-related [Anaerostipes sp. Marseille-Q3525]MBR9961258.1 Clp protease ClpP [Anaerostipes sp. Marseille-Q3525]
MKNKYYALYVDEDQKAANINIYGDITSYPWTEKDVSAYNLSKEIEGLDVEQINVYLNSYGGEVAEGIAIYNSLKRHKAAVKTVCDGMACSIASVIFMAGDERIMNNASLLMIHNAWTYTSGNADQLRKEADDLDKISNLSVKAYMEHINISEEELKALLDAETFLSPEEALEYGFATTIIGDKKSDKASQSAKKTLQKMILAKALENNENKEEDNEELNNSHKDDKTKEDPEQDDSEKDPEPDDPEEDPEKESEDDSDEGKDQNMQMFRSFFNALTDL